MAPAPRAFIHRPRCEPVESERMADANAELDAIEAGIRRVLDAGGEHALRLRIARLLPPS